MHTISAIIITYNNQSEIRKCLLSAAGQSEPFDHLQVIDNASTDDTARIVSAEFPAMPLVNTGNNRGFGAASNLGIKISRSDFIVILNGDVELDRDFVRSLKFCLENARDYRIGTIAPQISDNKKRIDSAGLTMTWIRRFYDRGRGKPGRGRFDSPEYVFGATGACVVYRRSMLEEIKIGNEYFDEDFFLLGEDIDLSWRAKLLGWHTRYCPTLRCCHAGGISRKKSRYYQAMYYRNRYWFILKNESILGLVKLLVFCWIYELPKLIYMFCTNVYTRPALGEMLRRLPVMARKRGLVRDKLKNNNFSQ